MFRNIEKNTKVLMSVIALEVIIACFSVIIAPLNLFLAFVTFLAGTTVLKIVNHYITFIQNRQIQEEIAGVEVL